MAAAAVSTPALRGLDIVCVGFAEWDATLWTNQQHLMSRLARDNRVLFLESLGLRRPTAAPADLRRIARRLRSGLRRPRRAGQVEVLSPLVLPFHGSGPAAAVNGRLLPFLVRRALRRLRMGCDILWAYVPQAEVLVEALAPRFVVYHCVDDIAEQKGVDAAGFRAAEQRFAGRADLVLASAPALAERMRGLSANVLYAPNVADHELFASALAPGPVDPALDALTHPRIVFTGAIVATKLDLELIEGLAELRPDWRLVLVGPVGLGDPRSDVGALRDHPNIVMPGARAYGELPAVLRGADAAFIPYSVNSLTRSVFPMKVYEYLSAGLPVVSTPLPSLDGVGGVARAATAAEMAERLEEALQEGSQARAERSRSAALHSWDSRMEEIAVAIERLGA
jgi:glycosyltransferase involved in cell wall biosynthesis